MNVAEQAAEAVEPQPAPEPDRLVQAWAERREVERRETHELADRLGRALAVELNDQRVEGGSWRHQVAPMCFVSLTLEHPSGMSLSLVHEGSHRKGAAGRRLTVRGGYPSEYIGWRTEPVTIGIDTSPLYQARHIIRRLLPDYQQTYAVAQDVRRRVQQETHDRRALNRGMRAVLPALQAASWDQPHDAEARKQSYWSTEQYRPDGSTAPRARCTGSVRLADHAESAEVLKLTDVPKDLLLQILALVNGQPVLEGRVMPRELGRHRPELPPAPQVIRL
ncbi:hypothetical protein ACIBBE_24000 [Streptomyces sp. NPDC051644]|uniref:hypothetical protein n=1 Tax=Streptomyces sp. NPDC051644 TaxID=3365666 RepID=UPI0037AEBD0F